MLTIISLVRKLIGKAKKGKKPEGKEKAEFPPGTKIGVFGHTNVGKTVFFTMLYGTTREDPKFKLTPDTQTGRELEQNFKGMKGQEITIIHGLRTDKTVARKFPPPTSETKYLAFVAVLNKRTKLPFISVDYRGEIASIYEQPELKEELTKFLTQSDCLLFFMEPNAIHSEVDCRAQVVSFNALLQRLSNGNNKSLNIPVGLVVTKADKFVGFEDESQANLIGRTCEYSKTKEYQKFVDQLLEQSQIKKRERWKEELKTIMNRLRTFFETLCAMNLDFQVFFVSALGNPPFQEIGDKGEVVMTPPRELKPIGIKEPFLWAIKRVLVRKRLNILRKLTKWVLGLTLIWVLSYSIPNLLNLASWYPKVDKVEKIIEQRRYQKNLAGLEEKNLKKFTEDYEHYANRFWVSSFFGMGGLKDFARKRAAELDSAMNSIPKTPQPVTLSDEEKNAVASLKERLKNLRALIRERQDSTEFLLGAVVESLNVIRQSIESLSEEARKQSPSVDGYLERARCWDNPQMFNITVQNIPEGYGLWVRSGGVRKGKLFPDSNTFSNIPWTKNNSVSYMLERDDGNISDSVDLGAFGILKHRVLLPNVNRELRISIEGITCKPPTLADL